MKSTSTSFPFKSLARPTSGSSSSTTASRSKQASVSQLWEDPTIRSPSSPPRSTRSNSLPSKLPLKCKVLTCQPWSCGPSTALTMDPWRLTKTWEAILQPRPPLPQTNCSSKWLPLSSETKSLTRLSIKLSRIVRNSKTRSSLRSRKWPLDGVYGLRLSKSLTLKSALEPSSETFSASSARMKSKRHSN